MKKILSTLILFCFAFCCFAQEHLSFKGIPIAGSKTAFCQKLKAKGFTQIYDAENVVLFSGDFAGRDATVGVVYSNDGKNVSSVGVFYDSSDEWKTLVNTYEYYKSLYTKKYGMPSITKEDNPATSDSNIALLAELNQGKVTYFSEWDVPGGEIVISIEKASGVYKGQVMIVYRDSMSAEVQRQLDLNDI